MSDFAVDIKGLEKSYGDTKVLQGLDIQIPKGKIFGLIGPNGAGKSTLIGVLTGLLKYESGEIDILGLAFNNKNEQVIKADMSSVLQPPLLFEAFTSHEFLDYVCDVYQESEEGRDQRISNILDYFDIADYEHVKVNKMSAGSRKKLAFCGAVLANPKLMFLDEPFEAVDVISIQRMKSILKKISDKGVTIFITSHILEVVENLCDEIAILNNGKIIAYLDEVQRKELKKDANLHEIFERYVPVEDKGEVLDWL